MSLFSYKLLLKLQKHSVGDRWGRDRRGCPGFRRKPNHMTQDELWGLPESGYTFILVSCMCVLQVCL